MTAPAILFIDRDGTLVEEPADEQVDRLDKISLLPGVIPALCRLQSAGFRFVMVSNQDGLGTTDFPVEAFRRTQEFIVSLFASQGIAFDAILICPHRDGDGCGCRKPATGLVGKYLQDGVIDRRNSYVVGDRRSDVDLAANMGLSAFRVGNGLDWTQIADTLLQPQRRACVQRTTNETDIAVELDIDAAAPVQEVNTGIGFFDHMLAQIARHGGISLRLQCQGDLEVDEHHTVEDTALALGQALREALGDRHGIGRYGFVLPMDEAQARIAIDLSGRPYFLFEGSFTRERVGQLPTELVPHFFRSLSETLGAAIQIEIRGENNHHMIEAMFKGVGRCLRQAMRIEDVGIPSTKGVL